MNPGESAPRNGIALVATLVGNTPAPIGCYGLRRAVIARGEFIARGFSFRDWDRRVVGSMRSPVGKVIAARATAR